QQHCFLTPPEKGKDKSSVNPIVKEPNLLLLCLIEKKRKAKTGRDLADKKERKKERNFNGELPSY
uniref:hypothetical protein n=1 Tax=Escherichia coli TaxID=562 RepID=UPI0025A12DCF